MMFHLRRVLETHFTKEMKGKESKKDRVLEKKGERKRNGMKIMVSFLPKLSSQMWEERKGKEKILKLILKNY